MPFEQLQFTIPEMLSLVGLAQCLYILVYMAFRSGDIKRVFLPFTYFLALAGAFFLDFASGFIGSTLGFYETWQWALWFLGPPLSVLLIIQVARINKMPPWPNFWVLLLIPVAWLFARFIGLNDSECATLQGCGSYRDALVIGGLCAGALSLLTIWFNRGMLGTLKIQKGGKDRYWLILTLIIINLSFLVTMFLSLSPLISAQEAGLIRTFLGLGFVYLAGTSLFRIYPQALQLTERRSASAMSVAEKDIAGKIEDLIELDKVYHEPSYSRADLARELELPETVVSRVINTYFGKSFPQLLNERRVEDAKRLLKETDEPVKIVAKEVGFNSIASFNRVFKDMAGMTAGTYRRKNKA